MTKKLVAVLITTLLFSGCAGMGAKRSDKGDSSQALDVSMALKFEDVPIPAGFKAVPKESFAFENELLRVGILKYSGRPRADNVVNFYKDQMPLYNWRFLNMLEYGERILNFDRDDQTCIIVVEPGKLNTRITITVAPKGGAASTYRKVSRERE